MSPPTEPLISLLPPGKPGLGLLGPVPLFHEKIPLGMQIKGNPGEGLLGPSPYHARILYPFHDKAGVQDYQEASQNNSAYPSKVTAQNSCTDDRPGRYNTRDAPGRSPLLSGRMDNSSSLGSLLGSHPDEMTDSPQALFDHFDSRSGRSGSFRSHPNSQDYFGSQYDNSKHFRPRFEDHNRFDDPGHFESSFGSSNHYERRLSEDNYLGADHPRSVVGRGSSDLEMGAFGAYTRNEFNADGFGERSGADKHYTWAEIMEWEDGELGFYEREPLHIRKAYDAAHQIARRQPVQVLKELCQRKNWPMPTYHSLMDGNNRNSLFQFKVQVNGEWHEVGRYSFSEKQAKIYATIRALYNLRHIF